jgi:hypothetical protein
MSTGPVEPAGLVVLIEVSLLTVREVASTPPNSTAVAPVKPVPVTVTEVFPPRGPAEGVTLLTAGTESYVNSSEGDVAEVPPAVVTTISTGPAEPAGLVAVKEVVLVFVMVTEAAGVVPKSTVVPGVKPVPVTVTDVPPASGPADGLTAVTVGTPSYLKRSAFLVAEVPPDVVTVTSTTPVPAGLVTIRRLPLTRLTPVAGVEPKSTTELDVKLLPLIVTWEPPDSGPSVGLIEETVGIG